jgi:hypothetical protein
VSKRFHDLVLNWGGFEQLVAELCDTGDVRVERNAILVGKSGAPRQIDVVIRHSQGLIEHLIVVECKYWKDNVERAQVDAFSTTVRDLNASRGILFSSTGFQAGALTQAKHEGIELFKVRDLRDQEWAALGRPTDWFFHTVFRTVDNLAFPGTHSWDRDLSSHNFGLQLGPGEPISVTPIRQTILQREKTLEEVILNETRDTAVKLVSEFSTVLFHGQDGTRLTWKSVSIEFIAPIQVPVDDATALLPMLSFDIGVLVVQTHQKADHSKDFLFVFAVEDCVRGTVRQASRQKDAKTKLETIREIKMPKNSSSAIHVTLMMEPLFDIDFSGLKMGEYRDGPGGEVDFAGMPNRRKEPWTWREDLDWSWNVGGSGRR